MARSFSEWGEWCRCACAGSALGQAVVAVSTTQQHPQLAFLPESPCTSPPSVNLLPSAEKITKNIRETTRGNKQNDPIENELQRLRNFPTSVTAFLWWSRTNILLASLFVYGFYPQPSHTTSPSTSSSLSSSIGQHQHPGSAFSHPHLSPPCLSVAPTFLSYPSSGYQMHHDSVQRRNETHVDHTNRNPQSKHDFYSLNSNAWKTSKYHIIKIRLFVTICVLLKVIKWNSTRKYKKTTS